MRSNLTPFVLVLVLVLGNQNFIEDEHEVRTLLQRVEVHENDIGFM